MKHCPVCCLCPECETDQEMIRRHADGPTFAFDCYLVRSKPRLLDINFCAFCDKFRTGSDIVLHAAFGMRTSVTGAEFGGFQFLVDLGRMFKDGTADADIFSRIREFSDRRRKKRTASEL